MVESNTFTEADAISLADSLKRGDFWPCEIVFIWNAFSAMHGYDFGDHYLTTFYYATEAADWLPTACRFVDRGATFDDFQFTSEFSKHKDSFYTLREAWGAGVKKWGNCSKGK